jgi:MscS family membrane protein
VDVVREILSDHEGLNPEYPPRVFFNEFNRDSFNIRMMVWYHPADYWEFLAFSQRVNQRIVEAFETEGLQFAPPTNVTYVSQSEDRPLRLDMRDQVGESDAVRRKVT